MKHKWLTVILAAAYIATTRNVVSGSYIDKRALSLPPPSTSVKNNTFHERLTENNKNESTVMQNEEVVYFAPKFKNPKKMYRMDVKPAGSSIRLKCASEGNPTPNITWYKNKKTPIIRTYFQPIYGKWSLILDELTKDDTGNYTCVICNRLGCIDYTTDVTIQERFVSKPYIKDGYPGNVTALINGNVTLTCPPFSDLEPYLYWRGPLNYSMEEINSIVVDSQDLETKLAYGNIIESENPEDKPETITLYNVTKEDEGWYVCIALNSLGTTAGMGYLAIIDSLPVVEATDQQYTMGVNIMTAVFGGVLIVAGVIVITTCRKLRREMKQKRLALEMARDVIETYWRKKVTIEKPLINNSTNAVGALVLPVITIEKHKVSEMKKNSDSDSKLLSEYELPLDKDWEVPRETVVLGKVLGEGEFGKVIRAECVGVLRRGQSTVAVKMLKDGHTDAEMTALVSEMEIMKVVGKHKNIINLLGCCTQDGPLYVLVEYAPFGSLKEFLFMRRPGNRKEYSNDILEKKQLTPQQLMSFAYQAAKGMEYLSSRYCIHRDLAARNVLVSENFIIKIADFGLAKNIENDDYYRKKTAGKLPVRWMAPESLDKMLFTIKTDVWSFGVLLWEIMTLGATPYRTVQGQYMYQHLRAGHRLEIPPGCRLDVYLVMRECWSFSPKERPSFTEVVTELDRILTTISNQEYLDLGHPSSDTSQVTATCWIPKKEYT